MLMTNLSFILLGLAVGIMSGILGLGGGLLLIPALVFVFGLTQHQAQGTSLAVMVPPITLLAVLRYYHSGNVKIGIAALIASGFAIGGLMGAHLVHFIPDEILKRVFGFALFAVSIKMLFF